MKKVLASLLIMFVLMVGLPLSAEAHNSCRSHRKARKSSATRTYRRATPTYRTAGYSYQRPSFYRKHRNLINLGLATGGGALIGALLGGKKGALIGTGVGAGSGALYTYVLNKKRRRY